MVRVIDQLRKLMPRVKWHYDNHYNFWCNFRKTKIVVPVSCHFPLYDGNNDRYITKYMLDYPYGEYLPIKDSRVHSSEGYRIE